MKKKLLKFGYPLQSACEGKAVRAGSVCSNDDFNREKKDQTWGQNVVSVTLKTKKSNLMVMYKTGTFGSLITILVCASRITSNEVD